MSSPDDSSDDEEVEVIAIDEDSIMENIKIELPGAEGSAGDGGKVEASSSSPLSAVKGKAKKCVKFAAQDSDSGLSSTADIPSPLASPVLRGLKQLRYSDAGQSNINSSASAIARCHEFWFPDALPKSCNYQLTWIVTAIVLSILKYVFCVVGAVIIHDVHPHFRNALAVGIGVQLASTLVTCCITSTYSKLGINVSGPDIIAAIFAGLWAKTLTDPAQGENTVLEVRKIFKQLLWQRHPCICYGCGDCSLYDSFTNLPFTSPLRRATP